MLSLLHLVFTTLKRVLCRPVRPFAWGDCLALAAGIATALLPVLPTLLQAIWRTRRRSLAVASIVWAASTFAPPLVALVIALVTAPKDKVAVNKEDQERDQESDWN